MRDHVPSDARVTLLDAASREAGREVALEQRHGRVEREVVAASAAADLLALSEPETAPAS